LGAGTDIVAGVEDGVVECDVGESCGGEVRYLSLSGNEQVSHDSESTNRRHFELILFSLFSFVFSLESFHPRQRVHHFSFSSSFTFGNGAATLGGTLGTFVAIGCVPKKEMRKMSSSSFPFWEGKHYPFAMKHSLSLDDAQIKLLVDFFHAIPDLGPGITEILEILEALIEVSTDHAYVSCS
jgi:hypothetical protein